MSLRDEHEPWGRDFPEPSAEDWDLYQRLRRTPVVFSYSKGVWRAENFDQEVEVERGNWPDEPMYIVWKGDKAIGSFDTAPRHWTAIGMAKAGCSTILFVAVVISIFFPLLRGLAA
jgi:hypothetical protein